MMILVTGTPGAGKTLNTIKDVHQEILKTPFFEKKGDDGIIEKYKREVYACNVNGIDEQKSGFKILDDPRQWTSLPPGSILIIDEASDFYPTSKKFGEELEGDVAELRKHRHYGIDIYYITQQPGLINKNIRILCGLHKHYQRNFGGKTTMCYKQNAVFETDLKYLKFAEKQGAEKSTVVLDKKYFGFYKSTEIDTHKSKLPLRTLFLKVILPIILLLSVLIWFFSTFQDRVDKYKPETSNQTSTEVKKDSSSLVNPISSLSDSKILSKEEYIDSLKPRIPFRAETAPIYDSVYKPVTYPKMVGCIQIGNDISTCECFTQQGTVYSLPVKLCSNYLKRRNNFDYGIPDKI